VPVADVERLARILQTAPVSQDAGLAALLSPSWLAAHAGESYGVLTAAQGECSPDARRLFVETFSSRDHALRALREHYKHSHTDDYPSIGIEIRFVGGKVIRASSHSQHALMLPWQSEQGATWDPAISAVVASLMPGTSRQRERLLEHGLATALATETGQAIRDAWEELEERCLYKDVVKALEGRLTIERVYHAWPAQFAGYLRLPGAPPNLLIDAHMNVNGNSTSVVDTFWKKAPIYVARVGPFVLSHPQTTFELWYEDGTSVSRSDLELHAVSRPDDPNVARVKASMADAVLLRDHTTDHSAGRNRIVLPSGEAIDWQE
jgi:hypothetical protein